MSHAEDLREAVDLWVGHPMFDHTPTPRPVLDDQPCGRCDHPRWMHAGRGECHRQVEGYPRCGCQYFLEEQSARIR